MATIDHEGIERLVRESRFSMIDPEDRSRLSRLNPETIARRNRQRRRRDAKAAVMVALASGRIVRPAHCQSCGAVSELEAHHTDANYYRKLDIVWLCKRCHSRITQRRI